MAHNTIAVIADCDDTLAPDTTVQLLRVLGIDPKKFFSEDVAQLVLDGWDPPLAYLNELARQGRTTTPPLTRALIEQVGRGLTFFPGIPECLQTLKSEVEGTARYRDFGVRVEFYVISEVLRR